MPIRFFCPSCGVKLKVPDGYEGKRIKCSNAKCAFVQVVPSESTRPETALEDTSDLKEGVKSSEGLEEGEKSGRTAPRAHSGEESSADLTATEESADPLAALAAQAGDGEGETGVEPEEDNEEEQAAKEDKTKVKPALRVPSKEADPARPSRPSSPSAKTSIPAADETTEAPPEEEGEAEQEGETEEGEQEEEGEEEEKRPARPSAPAAKVKKPLPARGAKPGKPESGEEGDAEEEEKEEEEEEGEKRPSFPKFPSPKVAKGDAKPSAASAKPAPKKKEESDEESAFPSEVNASMKPGPRRGASISASSLSINRPAGVSAKAPNYGVLLGLGWVLRLVALLGLVGSLMLYNNDVPPPVPNTSQFVSKEKAAHATATTKPDGEAATTSIPAANAPMREPIVIPWRPTVPLSYWGALLGVIASFIALGASQALFVLRDIARQTYR